LQLSLFLPLENLAASSLFADNVFMPLQFRYLEQTLTSNQMRRALAY
jgi:hypothetical protein